ncbi:MAG: 30S ribosomal protein S18 [Candidatus Neomarinimicrobiota bacterium]
MAFMSRRKVCKFCENQFKRIDYKDVRTLRRFVTEQGKIIPRRVTGVCARHQRMLTRSIKRARNIALIHYTLDVTQT